MFFVGFCRICGTGPLGLCCCGGCGRIVLLCDECEALWPDSDLAAAPKTGDPILCPECQQSLMDEPSHWATAAEIAATDWLQQAFRADRLKLQYAHGAAPENL